MADKTTTLKTKTNDNVYPNIIGDNRDNAISDSAHINHTLTAEHKINFRLDTNVSGLIFNSLQKPAGLTKTKLVGVGTNGQENIEIGDNLTLANGKLSATGGGGSGAQKLYKHYIKFWNSSLGQVSVQLYNYSANQLNSKSLLREEIEKNGTLLASGYFIVDNIGYPAREMSTFYSDVNIYGLTFDTSTKSVKQGQLDVSRFATIEDEVSEVK